MIALFLYPPCGSCCPYPYPPPRAHRPGPEALYMTNKALLSRRESPWDAGRALFLIWELEESSSAETVYHYFIHTCTPQTHGCIYVCSSKLRKGDSPPPFSLGPVCLGGRPKEEAATGGRVATSSASQL